MESFIFYVVVGLYVTESGMHDFFRDCGLFNKLDLSSWSALLIWVLMVFPSHPLSTNLSISARECFTYS